MLWIKNSKVVEISQGNNYRLSIVSDITTPS